MHSLVQPQDQPPLAAPEQQPLMHWHHHHRAHRDCHCAYMKQIWVTTTKKRRCNPRTIYRLEIPIMRKHAKKNMNQIFLLFYFFLVCYFLEHGVNKKTLVFKKKKNVTGKRPLTCTKLSICFSRQQKWKHFKKETTRFFLFPGRTKWRLLFVAWKLKIWTCIVKKLILTKRLRMRMHLKKDIRSLIIRTGIT